MEQALDELRQHAEHHSEGYPLVEWRNNAEDEARFFDEMAANLAVGYSRGRFGFEYCDFVANTLWASYIERFEQMPPPETLMKVYEAFDAGEAASSTRPYDDPIKTFTDPMIEKIVAGL